MGNITTVERMRRMGISKKLLSSQNMHYNCTVCGISKPTTDFYPDKQMSTGLKSKCKLCHKAAMLTPEKLEKNKIRNREARKKDLRVYMCYANFLPC